MSSGEAGIAEEMLSEIYRHHGLINIFMRFPKKYQSQFRNKTAAKWQKKLFLTKNISFQIASQFRLRAFLNNYQFLKKQSSARCSLRRD
jgi:hypothetical protein